MVGARRMAASDRHILCVEGRESVRYVIVNVLNGWFIHLASRKTCGNNTFQTKLLSICLYILDWF